MAIAEEELGRLGIRGSETIAQHQKQTTEPTGEIVKDPSWYSPDANGTVAISVATQYTGTKRSPLHFGTNAKLYSVSGSDEQRADVIDPLEGADDCGVRRDHSVGTAASVEFRNIDSAVLIDGDAEIPYELSLGSGRTFFNYGIDLSDQGVTPRFLGKYGFRAEGGTFGAPVSILGITLPESLTIHELEQTAHVERGALHLTWTGRNNQLMRLLVYISSQPRSDTTYTLQCLMKDDGEFEIPTAVMDAVPNGIARMEFIREDRQLMRDGTKALLTIGRVSVLHELAYGERCDRESVVDACKRYADKMQEVYADCGQEAPPLDELCPDYISEACTVCPEYYECMSKATTCTDDQITHHAGCSCPK
ncbi:MAG TPA: hypothetical protein VMF89_27050 [Polyangiales bacterium]|nr:hypothetical protein [Polyangiales bacterium]